MNASGTMRLSFIRVSHISFHTGRLSQINAWPNFTVVDYPEYQRKCAMERDSAASSYDTFDIEKHNERIEVHNKDVRETDITHTLKRVRDMFTRFPWRDPTYLVAIVFVIGSLDFTINAFFGLLPFLDPSTAFPTLASAAIPVTIFIGAFMFTAAGVLDFFGAFNADRGIIEIAKTGDAGEKQLHHEPALLGSENWTWRVSSTKFAGLVWESKPFLAGIMQLIGGLIFTGAAFASYPGVLDPTGSIFPVLVFAPQVVGGALFFVANMMVAVSCEQEKWWRPKPFDVKWQAAFQSAIGGFGFMITGIFLFRNGLFEAAIATFVGSWTFLIGSILGWYATMEIC